MVAVLFSISPVGLRLDRLLLDQHQSIVEPSIISTEALLVALDDNTLDLMAEETGGLHWPYPRAVHAQVIRRLLDAGARAIAVDIMFDLPSGYGPDDDRALADVLARGNVYFASEESEKALTPVLPVFITAGAKPANSALPIDIDGIIRWTPAALTFPRNAKEAALFFLGLAHQPTVQPALQSFAALMTDSQPPAGGLISFSAPEHRIERISYYEVYQPDLFESHRGQIKGRVVFLGRTPTASLTPGSQADTYLTPRGYLPGIEIHAQHFRNLQAHNVRKVVHGPLLGLLLGGWVLFLIIGLRRYREPLQAALLAFSAVPLWEGIALGLTAAGLLVPIVLPWALSVCLFLGSMAIRFLDERDARLITRAQLFHYLPPRVAEHVLENPTRAAAAGDRKEITLLFADVAGFTSLSEKESPERVLSILQVHLKDMAEAIFAHEGTLDKYLGDGIMAFWGAPQPQPDHADRALAAAIEMLDRVERENANREEQGIPRLVLRIGLHTGEAIVGNIGSELFFDYTAIGDSVNTAARLESANKEFGTRLLISESTRRQLSAVAAGKVSPVGRILVQGKSEVVEVSSLIKNGQAEAYRRLAMALESFDNAQAEEAVRLLNEIADLDPLFQPAQFHLKQVAKHELPASDPSGRAYWPLSSK